MRFRFPFKYTGFTSRTDTESRDHPFPSSFPSGGPPPPNLSQNDSSNTGGAVFIAASSQAPFPPADAPAPFGGPSGPGGGPGFPTNSQPPPPQVPHVPAPGPWPPAPGAPGTSQPRMPGMTPGVNPPPGSPPQPAGPGAAVLPHENRRERRRSVSSSSSGSEDSYRSIPRRRRHSVTVTVQSDTPMICSGWAGCVTFAPRYSSGYGAASSPYCVQPQSGGWWCAACSQVVPYGQGGHVCHQYLSPAQHQSVAAWSAPAYYWYPPVAAVSPSYYPYYSAQWGPASWKW